MKALKNLKTTPLDTSLLLEVADTNCGWCGWTLDALGTTNPVYLTLAIGSYKHRVHALRNGPDAPILRRVEVDRTPTRRAYCCKDHAMAHAEQTAEYETYHQGQGGDQ